MLVLEDSGFQQLGPAPQGAAVTGVSQVHFPREARLLKHADFRHVYESGKRHFSGNITVFFLRRSQQAGDTPRVGFTVSRALGGAVERNRMKRRLRAAVRVAWMELSVPADVVINPKKSVLTVDFRELTSEIARAFGVVRQRVVRGEASPRPISPRKNKQR